MTISQNYNNYKRIVSNYYERGPQKGVAKRGSQKGS
jgi:hypothetical protein